MYQGHARLEDLMRQIEQMLNAETDPVKIQQLMNKLKTVEYQRDTAEYRHEEDREYVAEVREELNARQQKFYDSIFKDDPEISQMIQENENLVKTTSVNLGFSQEETEELVTEYVEDTTKIREDFAKKGVQTIDDLKEQGIEVSDVEDMLRVVALNSEGCHHEDMEYTAQIYSEKEANAENRQGYKTDVGVNVQSLDLEYNAEHIRAIKALEVLNELKGTGATREDIEAALDEEIARLQKEGKEEFDMYHGQAMYSRYIHDFLEEKGMTLEEYLNQESPEKDMAGVELDGETLEGLKGVQHRKDSEEIQSPGQDYSRERVQEMQEEKRQAEPQAR